MFETGFQPFKQDFSSSPRKIGCTYLSETVVSLAIISDCVVLPANISEIARHYQLRGGIAEAGRSVRLAVRARRAPGRAVLGARRVAPPLGRAIADVRRARRVGLGGDCELRRIF